MENKETMNKNFPLRVKSSIFIKLEKEAKKQDRSINYMINKFIETALKEEN